MNIAIGAGMMGGAVAFARVFGRGQVHRGHDAPLPNQNGMNNGSFTNAQGLNIRTYEYPQTKEHELKDSPVAVTVLIHGIGSHAHSCFAAFPGDDYAGSCIESLNGTGFDVHMLDLQGHGRSEACEGRSCHVLDFEYYIDDIVQFLQTLRTRYGKNTKIFVVGMSMGGCIVAGVGQRMGDGIDGIVLLAPMLSVKQVKAKPINKVLLPFVNVLSRVVPLLPAGSKSKNTFFPDMAAAFELDPLTYTGKVRVLMARECIDAVDRTMANAAKLTAPCFIFHSKQDTMTDPEGSQEFFDKLQQQSKRLKLLDNGMWHCLTREPGNEEVVQEMIHWLCEQL